MKKLIFAMTAILVSIVCISAQTTGSIAGTVADINGALVPNATVSIKGKAGQEFTTTTSENGTYRVPAVSSGIYTVTVTNSGFKKAVFSNVKVDVGVPLTLDAVLEVGDVAQVVEVTTGGEVLQTQTATIGSTIQSRQILGTPIASRDALDIVGTLPGTATVGRPRTSTINGLPKGSLSITIDGVDVQSSDSRSSDGYFTYVRPRVDAIEEVTVSTANPGAESSGDGAIQIKMVTKRGANDYHVGAFWQQRNDAFNANYWYLNRNPAGLDKNGKSVRQKMRLNQYGFNGSGPIPFLKFGEGGGIFDSGKDRRFFFMNYEEFRQPQSLSRTRKIISPEAQAGTYQYFATIPTSGLPTGCATTATANQMLCARNVFTIAANAGQLATIDPTVAAIYSRIRTAISGQSLISIANNPNVSDWNTLATNSELRTFLALRFDVNITKKHSFEAVINRQKFGGQKDLLNGREETFPGFPSFNQTSQRNSYSFAVRSTFGQNIVNEARYAIQEGGPTVFAGDSDPSVFGFMGGRSLGIFPTLTGTAVTAPVLVNGTTRSKNPVFDFTDSVTWVMGNHSLNFGGNYKLVRAEANNNNRYVPSVGFGLDSTDSAFNIFSATTLPGASTGQLTDARNLYASLAGRVLSYTTTAYLNTTTSIYAENGASIRKSEQKSYGAFIQDSWRILSNFTINYGMRWQPQTGFVALSDGNYTRLENYDQVYGLSGLNNIFKPGTLTGTAPRVVKVNIGEKVYPDDLNNFAPTVGVVWSPNFGDKGFLRGLFGAPGQSVFRGGYSVAFVREGTALLESINGANPGGSQVLSRGLTITSVTGTPSFTVGTNLRDPGNPNLTPFEPNGVGTIIGQNPAFPIALTASNSTNAFNPNIKTGQVRSYSFGYQREVDKNTVIEVRYVGNQGTGLQRQYNLNEFNTIENGFAAEFKLAQDNLYANNAVATAVGATAADKLRLNSFAYFGAGTGTSQLPIMVSYFNPVLTNNPGIAQGTVGSGYTAANFANATLVASLSRLAPSIATFSGANFESNAARRLNAIANGRPSNFFYVNPTTPNGSLTVDNTNETWYNSAVIEVRRRLSAGLRVNANYVFSKAMANAFTTDAGGGGGQPPTNRRPVGLDLARNVQISDLRHQFKVDSTYDLPFGKGGQFFSNANGFVNALIGGWTLAPTLRWQSGSPISFGNVNLVGMTVKELKKAIKVRKEASLVFFLPDDIILNTQKAFNIDVTNTANGGYGTTYGAGGPTGKYIAPAGTGNCISTYTAQCGFANLVVYGPSFFKLDASLAKKIKFGERFNIELRATALDVLNHPNFRVGGFGGDTTTIGAGILGGFGSSTFGQLANTSAYQDTSTTNDPGGRVIDLMLRINW